MKYQKYLEIEKACKTYAAATVNGCRQRRNLASKLTADELRKHASKRTKNAKYFVWCGTVNHGTKKWPDLDPNGLEVVTIANLVETDKTFRTNSRGRNYVWRKEKIIGWLS